jgi:hypothetical protein
MALKLPAWLRRDEVKLPPWARLAAKQDDRLAVKIEIDSAVAYQEWLSTLQVTNPDQYWLEVAYQCIKLDVQSAIAGTKYDPKVAGKSAQLNMSRAPQYALAAHPRGRGSEAASRGKEARAHYARIRGRLPA